MNGTAQLLPVAPPERVPAFLQGQAPYPYDLTRLPLILLLERDHVLPPAAHQILIHRLLQDENPPTPERLRAALDSVSLSAFLIALINQQAAENRLQSRLVARTPRLLSPQDLRSYVRRVEDEGSATGSWHVAEIGLGALSACGPVGLRLLHRLAHRGRAAGVRKRAAALLEATARGWKMSVSELEEQLVPDLGLDPDGSMILDFGPRQFQVGFDENLVPFVRQDGALLAKLPTPNKKDDPELSSAASTTWKTLKQEAREVASTQIARLERAMIEGRRWPVDHFQDFFVDHPLMIHLGRRLLWGIFHPRGRLLGSFRIAEDRSLADAHEAPLSLAADARVGLLHPLQLEDDARAAWRQLFEDYQLLQPFPQVGREVYTLQPGEAALRDLPRYQGRPTRTGKLFGLLRRVGWARGPIDDDVFTLVRRTIGRFQVALTVSPGVDLADPNSEAPQRVERVRLENGLSWGDLSAVEISEVLRDLEWL